MRHSIRAQRVNFRECAIASLLSPGISLFPQGSDIAALRNPALRVIYLLNKKLFFAKFTPKIFDCYLSLNLLTHN